MDKDYNERLEKTGRRSRKAAGLSKASDRPAMERRKNGSAARRASSRQASSAGRGASGSGLPLHRERELRRRRKRRRMVAMIIAECFALALIFGYGYFLRHWNLIQRPEFNELEIKNNDLDIDTVEKMKGYWTIAVFGVDSRDKALTKSTNADVNLICNVNMDTGEIKLVSVYRDSYLNISKNGTYNKINQAYFMGGPEQAVAALNRNLDLDITDYMTFNWKAVADAINVLGGVDVEISKAEFYYINSFITETVKVTGVGSYHLKSAGMNHLDGVQAVAYGRLRLMDTDYARTERQRKIIMLAFEKAKKANFETLNAVLGTVFPQVATSINVNDIFNSLKIINRYHIGETTGFPQARGDANMGKRGACVIPQTLESNVVKLHEFLFGEENYTPSETVRNISAKIAADSGMYKEGKYVDHVGTEGGVIQSAKASKAAAASSAAAASEDKYAVIYVLDENGEKVKKSVVMKKDEDGEYIEPETDEEGLALGWSLNSEGKLVEKGTAAAGENAGRPSDTQEGAGEPQTDEEGNPIETSTHGGPGGPGMPGGSIRPTAAETDAEGNPRPTESTDRETLRPGFLEQDPSESDREPFPGTAPSPREPSMSPSPGPGQTGSDGNLRPTVVSAPGSAQTSKAASYGPGGGADTPAPTAGSEAAPTMQESSSVQVSGPAGAGTGPGGGGPESVNGGGPSSGVVAAPRQ